MLRERLSLERELDDLQLTGPERESASGAAAKPATVGFEFDINYGWESDVLTSKGISWDGEWECTNLTDHSFATEGFRVRTDGPRLEIATKPFEVNRSGRAEAKRVLKELRKFTASLEKACRDKGKVDRTITSSKSGHPRIFTLPGGADWKAKSFPDLPIGPLAGSKAFQSTCRSVKAAPQATITIPLSSVRELVRSVVATAGKGVGKALTGGRSQRQGLRSKAVWDARQAVRASKLKHLAAKTALPGGKVVSASNFTDSLEGFLILLVSYLRTSQLTYDHTPPGPGERKSWDYESFSKAYLPFNVKAPFYDLFNQLLTDDEREVFRELYGKASKRDELYALAESDPAKRSDSNMLFPGRTRTIQEKVFVHAPTWKEFIESACRTPPVKLIQEVEWPELCKHKKGDEVLFAPLSKIIGLDKTKPRVAIELRRIGFAWWPTSKWDELFDVVFKLTERLD